MNPAWISALVVVGTQAVVFFKWLHRRMRDDEINRAFVRDVATNHLPHLYSAMKQLAEAQGIELTEPPAVKWLELNGHRQKGTLFNAAD